MRLEDFRRFIKANQIFDLFGGYIVQQDFLELSEFFFLENGKFICDRLDPGTPG